MTISDDDRRHLARAVQLAAEALDAGDEPFGSVLVSAGGAVLAEDRNRVGGGDETMHPEFELARWAARNLDQDARAAAVVYTSGEHCPMCAAAHAWVGLGRIVYAASASQIGRWRASWGVPVSAVSALPIGEVAPGVPVEGPVAPFDAEVRALLERSVKA